MSGIYFCGTHLFRYYSWEVIKKSSAEVQAYVYWLVRARKAQALAHSPDTRGSPADGPSARFAHTDYWLVGIPVCFSHLAGSLSPFYGPSHPASRADSHHNACPLSLQLKPWEC